jgi:carbonic anhydrase/acetyltransferase-like protein (isoleucine patch superfamily)
MAGGHFMPIYEYDQKRPNISVFSYIHPEAVIIGDVKIAENCYIAAGAVLRGDFGKIIISRGSNVQENAVIHTQPGTVAMIGENVLISHSAVVHGPCTLEDYVSVGISAVICPGCTMEKESYLGAGSILLPKNSIGPKQLAVGNPAKIIKEMEEKSLQKNKDAVHHYQELSQTCIKSMKLIK